MASIGDLRRRGKVVRASAMGHRDLAIYDMDKTITRVATWTPFLRHALKERGRGALWLLPMLIAFITGALVRVRRPRTEARARPAEALHRPLLRRVA